MQRGHVPPGSQPLEHVADIADERIGYWRCRNPSVVMPNLQTADFILLQQGQESVVGVLAHAKFVFIRAGRRRRIVEDAEKHGRVAGVALEEVVMRKAETDSNSTQQ